MGQRNLRLTFILSQCRREASNQAEWVASPQRGGEGKGEELIGFK